MMKRLIETILILLALGPGLALAQSRPVPWTWGATPILNRSHPLMRDQRLWLRALPGLAPGNVWIDLINRFDALFIGTMPFTTALGWNPTDRRGGYMHVASDGNGTAFPRVNHDPLIDFERTDSWTIAAWYKATPALTGTAGWWDKAYNSGNIPGYSCQCSGQKLGAQIKDTVTAITAYGTTTQINDNTWHHVVCRYDGSSTAAGLTLMVDGTSEAATVSGGPLTGTVANIGNLGLAGSGYWGPGALDDIRLWGRRLADAEILALYLESLRGDPTLLSLPSPVVGVLPLAGRPPGSFLPFFR